MSGDAYGSRGQKPRRQRSGFWAVPALYIAAVLLTISDQATAGSALEPMLHGIEPWRGVAELIAIILGAAALWLAWVHANGLRKQTKVLEGVTNSLSTELARISGSLSTRYIGPFPSFIPQIAELIRDAPDGAEVIVACDLPNYGHISAPESWASYRSALLDREGAAQVRMIFLNELMRDQVLAEQFRISEENWDEWKTQPCRRSNLEKFLKREHVKDTVDGLGLERFQKLLLEADRDALHELRFADVKEISEALPIYFWVAGETSAVFTVPGFAEDTTTEHGFKTSDARLVKALCDMYQRLLSRSGMSAEGSASV